MPKDVDQLSVADAEKLLDLFIECCRVGVELDIPRAGMAGTLQAFAKVLEKQTHPLSYYVDNPRGLLRRALTENDLVEARAESAKWVKQRKDDWKDF